MGKINLQHARRLALTIALLFTIIRLATPNQTAKAVTIAEGFDNGVPGNWKKDNRSSPAGNSQWVQCATNNSTITVGFIGGLRSCVSADVNSTTGGSGTISNWLISPVITTLKNNDIISFYTRTRENSVNPDRLQVRLSTNGANCSPGAFAFTVGDFTTLLLDINPSQGVGGYPENWSGRSVTLSGITGTVTGCVAFRYYLTNAGPTTTNGLIVAVDEFRYQDSAIVTPTRTATLTPTPSPTRTPTRTPTPTPSNTFTLVPPRTDTIGVYKDGNWYLKNSNSAGPQDIFAFWLPGPSPQSNVPVVGDWNGDGVDTLGVFDRFNGIFILSDSNTSPTSNYEVIFGNPGDFPLHGRWTNNPTLNDGIGVYRDSNGIIYLKNQLTNGFDDFFLIMGNPGDVGIAGDWNFNGVDTIGVYRPLNQTWYLSNTNGNGITFSDISFEWLSSNRIIAGDWNADGIMTVGYLTNTGVFSLHNSLSSGTTPPDTNFAFGPTDGYPIAGRWIPGSTPPKPGSALLGNIPGTLRPTDSNPGEGD
jgi:hypothetical protein